jgi:tetratricopeptide (TPR) repeat protein
MATVSLCMIVKDEFDEVTEVVGQAVNYFDEVVLVVSDKNTANKLSEVASAMHRPPVKVFYRKWNDRFDEARNFALSKVTSDYWFWLDTDDSFDFSTIPQLVDLAESGNYDQIMLPYNYAQDENGQCIAYHWRERLMRMSHPFVWKGWVHETPISDVPFRVERVNIEVKHNSSPEHVKESLERNHKILLEATAESDDPRYQMYLGTSLFSLGKYGEAVEVLDKFTKISGNVEDVYRSLNIMSECAFKMKHPNAAMQYALQAAAQIPDYPMAFRLLAQWEDSQGNWAEGLEWAKVADSKPEPTGMGVFDPSSRHDVMLIACHCEFMLGNPTSALKWLTKLPADHPARLEMEEDLRDEANAETFVTLLPKMRKYFESEESLFNALCYDMKYDVRLRGLRDLVTPPKTWSDNSIVILCGEGYEEWGAHTLESGMGGSEEAVVYLSRELAELGWEVTVYGPTSRAYMDHWHREGDDHSDEPMTPSGGTVTYTPWKEINKSDNFNVFVAWRAPEFAEHIKAKVKIADIHDILGKNAMKPYPDVTYFVKSQFHRNLYPELPEEKFRIIGNGIVKNQFKEGNKNAN